MPCGSTIGKQALKMQLALSLIDLLFHLVHRSACIGTLKLLHVLERKALMTGFQKLGLRTVDIGCMQLSMQK